MIPFIILTAITALVLFAVFNYKPDGQKNKPLKEALDIYNNHLFTEALKKFKDLLNEDPYNSIYHWYIALCAIQRQEYTTAMYHLESILQINNYVIPAENLPDIDLFHEVGVNNKLMEIFEVLKLHDKILSQSEKLMNLDPGNDTYPLKIAQSLIDDKIYSRQTQEYIDKTLAINPKNANAHFLLSLVYYKRGEFENALQSAEKTIALDKMINDAYFIMGFARYRLNLKDEAERHFRDATLCKYFKKSTAFYLAKLIVSSGKIEYALPYAAEACKTVKSIHEDISIELESMYLYATLLEQKDSYEEALNLYKSIQNLQPDYLDVPKRLKYMAALDTEKNTKMSVNPLEIFKKMKREDFMRASERVLKSMGYKIKKMDLVNDQTINMIALHTEELDSQPTGVFVRRDISIIQEEHIKKIQHFMSGMQTVQAILITPNDFNPAAKKLAEKNGIRTINGEQLTVLLAKK